MSNIDEVISLPSASSSSSVQVVEVWDASLRRTQPFKDAYEVFNGQKYKNPALAKKREMLAALVVEPAKDFFESGTSLAKLYDKVKKICKPRQYSSDSARNREWTQEFVAQHLALLVALWSKREAERKAPTRSSRSKRQKSTTPSNNNLKRAFKKLVGVFTDAKVLYDKERLAELNRVHRTPSLDRQLSGPRRQDSVPWNPTLRDRFACCTCTHMYTMCVEVNSDVN